MKLNFKIVTIRKNYGRHGDVYKDFEHEIIKYTGWRTIKAPYIILQLIFNKFILPKLKTRKFNFNLPALSPEKKIFASVSGTEYAKIFLPFCFKAHVKALYMFDTWPTVHTTNENALRSFKINIAFISAKQGVNHFNSLSIPDFKAYWIPEAINSNSYKYSDYDKKEIDLLQYGRQWKWFHDNVHAFCLENKIRYEYPAHDAFDKTQFNSRELLIEALAKTKIAVCVPRTLTNPEDVINQTSVTTRYFECMSSKCLILGKAPDELIELFGYNPVIETDMSNPQQQLSDLIKNYESYIPLIEKNYQQVLHQHQWKNRIEKMIEVLSAVN
jgi:hypothetical protein